MLQEKIHLVPGRQTVQSGNLLLRGRFQGTGCPEAYSGRQPGESALVGRLQCLYVSG